jgi:hypothetical protein
MGAPEAKLLGVLAAILLVPLILAGGVWWFSRANRKRPAAEQAERSEPADEWPNPFGDPD